MSEYIIEWFGIGEQLTRLREGNVPFVLWPKLIREERRREEIVRCRDCKEYRDADATCHSWQWHNWETAIEVEPDGFCAWGARREP